MYQVQARVRYPGKLAGWSGPTRDMPTVLFNCAFPWEAAAKTVQMLDPLPDSGITVNMTVTRVPSLHGIDIRAPHEREKPLEDETEVIEYFRQKNGIMSQLPSAGDFVSKEAK